MTHLATLITDLALLLIVAGITTLLCKRLKQPTVIGYILAGFLIGPVVDFVPTLADVENINLWAEIGIIFLMFGLGLEFSLHKLASVGSTGITAASVQVIGMVIVGFVTGQLMGWSVMNSIFLGGMLSMSSTMITIKAVEDMGLKDRPFVQPTVGTLVIEDIAAIFMMVVLSTIAVSQGISGGELAGTLGKMAFYLVLWLILGIYLIPSFLKKAQSLMNDETLLVVSLGICFGMVWLADALGFSSALGAFIAGSILAGTVHAEQIEHLVAPCKDLFGAVFFVSVGLKVVPAMLIEYLGSIILLTVIVIVGKALLLTIGMLAAGEKLSDSLYSALSQTQIGEFSFIIATLGISLGVTGDFLYPVIVAVSVVTTFTTPYLIKSADRLHKAIEALLPDKWRKNMERYEDEKSLTEIGDEDWKQYLKGYFSTFAINGVVVFGLMQIGFTFMLPFLQKVLGSTMAADVISCVVIYILIVPFLPAMMIFRKRYFTALWLKSFANHLPLMFLVALRTAVTILLMMLPLYWIFHLPLPLLLVVAVPATYLLSKSNWLVGRYLQIEAHFLSNFNERRLQEQQGDTSHSWLDEQLYVAEYVVSEGDRAVFKSLKDLQWGRVMQINVIKIIRGRKHMNIPEGDEELHVGDHLFVLGTDKALENFEMLADKGHIVTRTAADQVTLRQFISHQERYEEDQQLLCYAVKVEKDSPLAGTSIRDSQIKTNWSCFLVGLERDLLPIVTPLPSMILSAGDLIWVLGSQKMGSKLVKEELI